MNTEITLQDTNEEALNSDRETAEAILSGLTDLVDQNYGVISFVNNSVDSQGNLKLTRKNFSFIKTEAGAFEYSTDSTDFLNWQEFSSYLGSSLRPSPEESSILVLAVFDFDELDIPEGQSSNAVPRDVFQWVIQDGSIKPDYYCETEWNGIKAKAGPEFVTGEPDEYLGYIGGEEEFELPDTDMVAEFMQSLVQKAPDGNHVITVVLSDVVEGYNTSDLTFHKSGDDIVIDQTRGGMVIIDISTTIAAGEHAGVTLRSYLNRAHDDGFEINEEAQEVRSWHLSLDTIHPLSADECRETYCIDEETGNATSPESYVAYCDAWTK